MQKHVIIMLMNMQCDLLLMQMSTHQTSKQDKVKHTRKIEKNDDRP